MWMNSPPCADPTEQDAPNPYDALMLSRRGFIARLSAALAISVAAVLAHPAVAMAADSQDMLKAGDMPYSSGGADGPVVFAPDLPAVAGLQLCDATLGTRNVSIAGPKKFSQVLIPAGSGGVVSQLAYEFTSAAVAQKAWRQAVKAVKQCDGKFKGQQAGLGSVRTILSNGKTGESRPNFWVNHSDLFSKEKSTGRATDVRLSVFTQVGKAILVTSYTKTHTGALTDGQRDAIYGLAETLSQRWAAAAG